MTCALNRVILKMSGADSSEARTAVSFTFQKKSTLSKVNPVVEEPEKKDFVLSLDGKVINRSVGKNILLHSLSWFYSV